MPDFPLDADNNVVLTNGDLQINDRRTDVKQRLRQRLRLFFAEWFRNPDDGVKYLEAILVRPFKSSVANREIRRHCMRVAGVTSIIEITVTPDLDAQSAAMTVKYKDDADGDETQEVTVTV